MATTTSSSKRSSRRTRKAVRSDKGRPNRQKASTAKVTNSSTRPTNSGAKVTNSAQRTSTGTAKVTGSPRKALPPGKPGGALATTPKTQSQRQAAATQKLNNASQGSTGGNRVGQPAGAANRVYGADAVNASVKRAQNSVRTRNAAGASGIALSAVTSAPQAAEDIKNIRNKGWKEHVKERLAPYDSAMPPGFRTTDKPSSGSNKGTKPGNKRGGGRTTGAAPTQPSKPGAKWQDSMYGGQAKGGKWQDSMFQGQRPSPGAPTRTASDGQSRRQDAQRASSGSVTPSSGSSRPSPSRPSQAAPRTTTGAAKEGRKWEDFNKGRGTSETNNPLIKNSQWLSSKIKEREEKQSKNVGPTKDGGEYAASKKASDVVARRKQKEEEEKKKSAALKAGYDGNKNY
jgi:hypothetical protein